MSVGKRVTRLMKAYLNHHWERIEAIIREQEQEAQARAEALQELERPATSESAPPSSSAKPAAAESEISRAYRTLGLEEGADLSRVRRAYQELSRRAHPERFPEGSPERARAEQIHTQIEWAYRTLLAHLDQSAARFRNLDLD
ncbi:DnaJ domain-containing protein [Armatimonadetes bacterium GBS]|jgi:DnaJ-class molecular chaperone|nr:DnaJ domain-containing protein [Armatimonadetes bacterium GBS]CUU37949.1 DnaJ domain-containing protein [Armatimonadetes bacterium GXS]